MTLGSRTTSDACVVPVSLLILSHSYLRCARSECSNEAAKLSTSKIEIDCHASFHASHRSVVFNILTTSMRTLSCGMSFWPSTVSTCFHNQNRLISSTFSCQNEYNNPDDLGARYKSTPYVTTLPSNPSACHSATEPDAKRNWKLIITAGDFARLSFQTNHFDALAYLSGEPARHSPTGHSPRQKAPIWPEKSLKRATAE